MKPHGWLVMSAVLTVATPSALAAQLPAGDASVRLREVLPPDVASRVLATIAAARSHDLPAQALENRALKFAARGVAPADIERAISEQADRMARGRDMLEQARSQRPSGDEIDAAAEALRKGVDRAKINDLAKAASSGRSLAVPLYVMGSLIDRGLPSADALRRVRDRLQARASDSDLEQLAGRAASWEPPGQARKSADDGREVAETKHPGSPNGAAGNGSPGGGPPAGVPANGGRGPSPKSHKPATPPGKKP
jgi:hypothetical protein